MRTTGFPDTRADSAVRLIPLRADVSEILPREMLRTRGFGGNRSEKNARRRFARSTIQSLGETRQRIRREVIATRKDAREDALVVVVIVQISSA